MNAVSSQPNAVITEPQNCHEGADCMRAPCLAPVTGRLGVPAVGLPFGQSNMARKSRAKDQDL